MLDGSTTQATYKQIAERLNDPNAPAYKVNEQERPYVTRDIRTLVNRLFPKAFDVQQMIAHLNNLKQTKGYEGLQYNAKFMPSPDAESQTLLHIGITMPNASQLMRDFGGVLYVDATFGLVVNTFKGLIAVVVDGEAHNHLICCFLTPGHSTEEWRTLFNEIAKIVGVDQMDKIILMHDQEEAILNASDIVFRCAFCLGVHAHPPAHTRSLCCQGFMSSELNGKTETVETCFIHGEWTIAAGKMLQGGTFGKAAAKKYCDNVRLASCEPHYNDALETLVAELLVDGDRARAEHVQAVLASEDIPLCKSVEEFLALTNNPAEQTFFSMKGHVRGKKGRRMSMTQFVTKTMNLTREQSQRPTVDTKVTCLVGWLVGWFACLGWCAMHTPPLLSACCMLPACYLTET